MQLKTKLYNQNAEAIGEITLSEKVFGVKSNIELVHQAYVAQTANMRQVLAHTKTKAEVRGGGRKPWRQKGTGRARAGSSRSPIWIGGGITFGPRKNRNFKKKINKKMRQKAICMVLSDRFSNGNLIVLDGIEIKEYKTKTFNDIIKKLESSAFKKENSANMKKQERSILIINDNKDDKIKFSGRNLKGVQLLNSENINIVDLLKYKNLIVTSKATGLIGSSSEEKIKQELK